MNGTLRQWGVLTLLAALGTASSLILKTSRWIDEEITLRIATQYDVWGILTQVPLHQPNFPTYYLLVHLIGEQGASVVSVLALPLTAIFTFFAALAYHENEHRAIASGALIAVSPFLGVQAGWIRMYSLLTALVALGLVFYFKNEQLRATTTFAGAAWLHPYGALPLLWHWIVSGRKTWNRRQLLYLLGGLPSAALLSLKLFGPRAGVTKLDVTHTVMLSPIEIAVLPIVSIFGAHMYQNILLAMAALLAFLVLTQWKTELVLYLLISIGSVWGVSVLLHPLFRAKYFGFLAPVVAIWLFETHDYRLLGVVKYALLIWLLVLMWPIAISDSAIAQYYLIWPS